MDRTPSTALPTATTAPAGSPAAATEGDADLVRRAQAGDAAAFADLYEEYAPAVARFLRRRLHGPDELVEDLTAEVFLKVYEKLDRYQERSLPFAAWLYRVTRNHLVDRLRALPRQTARSLDEAGDVPEQVTDRAFGRVLDRQVLGPALAQLTPEQRRVVELRFLEGRAVADTAALLGRSEEAVKKFQARGLANLRRLLEVARSAQPASVVRAASAVA